MNVRSLFSGIGGLELGRLETSRAKLRFRIGVPAVAESQRLTAKERELRARLASHESWAQTADRSARTAPARAALDAKFLEQAGGDPVRAEHLRKAYYARLALKSAQARRRNREARAAAKTGVPDADAQA